MATLNDFLKTDLVDDHVAEDVNDLIGAVLRAEYRNVETITATKELTDGDCQFQNITASGADRTVELAPEATTNHFFLISNVGGSNNVVVKDDSGSTTYITLAPGEWAMFVSNGSTWKMLEGRGTLESYFDTLYQAIGASAGGKYPAFVRLSVASGNPNPTTSLAAQTSVYAMLHNGNTIPQWDGSDFAQQEFTDQTLTLNAAHTANSLYDIYSWMDGATHRIVTGPAWSSGTSRGTGAGTAETEVVNGVTVNKVSMTVRNGANTYTMAARYGTLIGTMQMSANGQVDWTPAFRGLWNKYNKMIAGLFTCPGYADDNAASSYLTTGTSWAEANGGTGARVKWVQGEPELIDMTLVALTTIGASSSSLYGMGLDSVTQADASGTSNNSVAATGSIRSNNKGLPIGIGAHYAALLIARGGANNATFYADAGRRGGEAVDSPETYLAGVVMM